MIHVDRAHHVVRVGRAPPRMFIPSRAVHHVQERRLRAISPPHFTSHRFIEIPSMTSASGVYLRRDLLPYCSAVRPPR